MACGRILPLIVVALHAQATPCVKSLVAVMEAWAELHSGQAHDFVRHPAEYWRGHGCISSWHNLIQMLRERRLIDAEGTWQIERKLLWKVLREQLLPSVAQTRMALECKLSRTWQSDLPA
eukprot:2170713-Amphidinium_carterae.1